jgi:hypothetical protein
MLSQSQALDSESIADIREYVNYQCDIVRSIVDKLNAETKYRYIRLMIFNILDHCVNLLNETDGF